MQREVKNVAPVRLGAFHGSIGRTALRAAGLASALGMLLLLAPMASAQNAPTVDSRISGLEIESQILGEKRVVLVGLPRGYEGGSARYPVLYMTDGNGHIGHTTSTIDFLVQNGRVPDMIVVGIVNTDRTRDLTPTRIADPPPQLATAGGADRFLDFIERELIPVIESRYRTAPYKVFAGHSFGGLLAIHTMVSRPDLFNSYIAVSPSLQWDDQVILNRAEKLFESKPEWDKRLFVSIGNEPAPISDSYVRFTKLLEKRKVKGLDWEARKMEDEDHGSVVLRSHYHGLRKVFQDWPVPRDPQTGQIAGGFAGVEKHYRTLSERFGYEITAPEAMVNIMGYQLLGAGQVDQAIEVFKKNVAWYPESANVYDSLAEAYERSGKLDLALPNYERAYKRGIEIKDANTEVFRQNFERVREKVGQSKAATEK